VQEGLLGLTTSIKHFARLLQKGTASRGQPGQHVDSRHNCGDTPGMHECYVALTHPEKCKVVLLLPSSERLHGVRQPPVAADLSTHAVVPSFHHFQYNANRPQNTTYDVGPWSGIARAPSLPYHTTMKNPKVRLPHPHRASIAPTHARPILSRLLSGCSFACSPCNINASLDELVKGVALPHPAASTHATLPRRLLHCPHMCANVHPRFLQPP